MKRKKAGRHCWAKPLGGCSTGISREHIVSASVFSGPLVKVSGFSWCKGRDVVIGVNSITSKNLCRKHNSELSQLDAEIGKYLSILKAIRKMEGTSKFEEASSLLFHRSLNGFLVERWFLKTAINILWGADFKIGMDSEIQGVPSDRLLNLCFGKTPWPSGRGLYFMVYRGQQISLGETVEFRPIIDKANGIATGFLFQVSGFAFYLSIDEDPFTEGRNQFWGFGNDLDGKDLRYRMTNVEWQNLGTTYARLEFKWQEIIPGIQS